MVVRRIASQATTRRVTDSGKVVDTRGEHQGVRKKGRVPPSAIMGPCLGCGKDTTKGEGIDHPDSGLRCGPCHRGYWQGLEGYR